VPLQKNRVENTLGNHLGVSYLTVNGTAAETAYHHPQSLDSAVVASYCNTHQVNK
jgi:hypothetical protein